VAYTKQSAELGNFKARLEAAQEKLKTTKESNNSLNKRTKELNTQDGYLRESNRELTDTLEQQRTAAVEAPWEKNTIIEKLQNTIADQDKKISELNAIALESATKIGTLEAKHVEATETMTSRENRIRELELQVHSDRSAHIQRATDPFAFNLIHGWRKLYRDKGCDEAEAQSLAEQKYCRFMDINMETLQGSLERTRARKSTNTPNNNQARVAGVHDRYNLYTDLLADMDNSLYLDDAISVLSCDSLSKDFGFCMAGDRAEALAVRGRECPAVME
jgi:predicted  nucleic acid-binding Zn-ribbon protein